MQTVILIEWASLEGDVEGRREEGGGVGKEKRT